MKLIGLASKNPVKGAAALLGFQRMFADEELEVRSVSVSSGVGHQPLGLLTANVVDRTQLYAHAVILAWIPFKNRPLYRSSRQTTRAEPQLPPW